MSNIKSQVSKTVTVYFCIDKSQTRCTVRALEELGVTVLLETTLADRTAESIHPVVRTLVLHYSPLLKLLMMFEAFCDAEKN